MYRQKRYLRRFIRQKDASDLEAEDGWYRWSVTIPADVLEQRNI